MSTLQRKRAVNIRGTAVTAVLAFAMSLFMYRLCFAEGYYFISKGIMSDLVRVNLPTYYLFYDKLRSGMSLWSWEMGLGTSIFSHADIAGDPFTYLLFLGGRDHIADMFVWNQVARNVFAAITMYCYLEKLKADRRVCIAGGLLYAFSGIQIFGNNFALGTICVYAPLVLLGIECFLQDNKCILLIVSLALTALYSYYFFYGLGIMSAIYLTFRIWMRLGWNMRIIFARLLQLAVVGVLCVGCAFFLMYPQIRLTLANQRTNAGKDISWGLELFLPNLENLFRAAARMLDLNIFGDMVNQNSQLDYFEFTTFISAASVPFVFQYYAYSNKRTRRTILACVLLCVAAITIPCFSYLMNMFSTINYRWMYILNILLTVGSVFGMQKVIENKGFRRNWLYVSILGLLEVFGVTFFAVRGSYIDLTAVEKRSLITVDVSTHRRLAGCFC